MPNHPPPTDDEIARMFAALAGPEPARAELRAIDTHKLRLACRASLASLHPSARGLLLGYWTGRAGVAHMRAEEEQRQFRETKAAGWRSSVEK